MTVTVKIEGLSELDAKLGELSKAAGKAALRRSLKKSAEPLAALMQSLAPDREGSPAERDLRQSIAVSTKLSKRQASMHRKMFRNDKASVEMFVGAGKLPHPHLVEFGTFKMDPQPFARPAWDQDKMALLERLKDAIRVEIEKSVARARRKAARLAAKG